MHGKIRTKRKFPALFENILRLRTPTFKINAHFRECAGGPKPCPPGYDARWGPRKRRKKELGWEDPLGLVGKSKQKLDNIDTAYYGSHVKSSPGRNSLDGSEKWNRDKQKGSEEEQFVWYVSIVTCFAGVDWEEYVPPQPVEEVSWYERGRTTSFISVKRQKWTAISQWLANRRWSLAWSRSWQNTRRRPASAWETLDFVTIFSLHQAVFTRGSITVTLWERETLSRRYPIWLG